ncbi:MFS general substrate transporter [Peniophora sp. CONT]|nr:MFS general substrate transporter [Peniophora sp. CONT]
MVAFLFPLSLLGITMSVPAKLEFINIIACRDIYGSVLSITAGPERLPCLEDPKVQASAATIIAAINVIMGVLNCCTAPVWGTMSDRRGRMFVQRIYALGPLLSDMVFLLVVLNPSIPGGRWIVIATGIIDGSFGLGTLTTAQAYIADTADTESTSRWYSLLMGAYYAGSGLGPLSSAFIAHAFGPVSVFYAGICIHLIFLVLVFFVIPESLVPAQMETAQQQHKRDLELHHVASGGLLADLKKAGLSVGEPLAVFLPSSWSFGIPSIRLPSRSWGLTVIALAYLPDTLLTGAGAFYLQYGMVLFGWGTAQLGLVISANQVSKASYLMVILPFIIKLLRPADSISPPASRDVSPIRSAEDTPLLARDASRSLKQKDRGLRWDLGLARISLLFQIGSLLSMSFASRSVTYGLGITSVALGAAFVPTVQSFSLELYRRRGGTESGRLFGALNVVSSLGQQILGPGIMGLIYTKSVETMPQLIFYVGTAIVLYAFVLMLFVNVPPDYSEEAEEARETAEQTIC